MKRNNKNIEFILEQMLSGKPKEDFTNDLDNEKFCEVKKALGVVDKLKSLASFNADKNFRDRLKNEFISKVKMKKVSLKSGKTSVIFLRFKKSFAISLAFLLLSLGTALASTNAMPDSPLYPVKKAIEAINKTISYDGRIRALKILNFNYRRVREIKYLQKIGDNKKIPQLMKEINQNIKELKLILAGGNLTNKEELKRKLNNFLKEQYVDGKPTKKESTSKSKNQQVQNTINPLSIPDKTKKVQTPVKKPKKPLPNQNDKPKNFSKDEQAPSKIKPIPKSKIIKNKSPLIKAIPKKTNSSKKEEKRK